MPKINWDYKKVMEGMSDEELKKRMSEVLELKLDNEIKPIPFIGELKQVCTYTCDELIARCPVTGYPDINKLTIKLIPNKLIPELKSLKFYLMEYIDIPISHEHLADKIYKYLLQILSPAGLYVRLDVNIRGGITTVVEVGAEPKAE